MSEEAKKAGRPPIYGRVKKISVRLDPDADRILTEYCQQTQLSTTNAVNEAIKRLKKP